MTKPVSPTGPRPNIFVVGDAKCGTTSLYRMIQLAPGIETSRLRKEQHYFSAPELVTRVAGPGDERIPGDIVQDEASYLADFAHVSPHITHIADVSPSYLQNPAAARRIHEFAPQARIVILLRDPASKVFSQYVHLWSEDREPLSFEEGFAQSIARREAGYSDMFDYEGGGRYARAVQYYIDLFGRDAVQVEIFEDLFGPEPARRRALASFMGTSFPDDPPPRMNAGGKLRSDSLLGALLNNDSLRNGVKSLLPLEMRTRLGQKLRAATPTEKPRLAPEMRAHLEAHFASDARDLEGILGRQTGWATARA